MFIGYIRLIIAFQNGPTCIIIFMDKIRLYRVQNNRITFIGHATILIEMGGLRILTDPLLRIGFSPQAPGATVNAANYQNTLMLI